MFCPRCGKEIQGDAAYCPQCGNRLGTGFSYEKQEPYPKRNLVLALSFLAGVAVSVLLTCIGNFFFLFLFFPFVFFRGSSSSPVFYAVTGGMLGLMTGTLAALVLRAFGMI